MGTGFESFVLFAEMRTGSNLLEANLNLYPELACLGEVFNPHFLAYPDQESFLGFDQAQRDADPQAVLEAIRAAPGVNGFRYFHDHHPAVFDAVMADKSCAKIVLTRNPAESYVSWKIAQATGQWKLTNATNRKEGRAAFDRTEFEAHLAALQGFQIRVMNALQRSGQTAFYIDYEDLQDVEIMNGLARYLGSDAAQGALSKTLKKQNPAPLREKVANWPDMERALQSLDRFNLGRTPNFEPRRGPAVPSYVAAPVAPLLFLPIRSGPSQNVRAWLSDLDGGAPVLDAFTQKSLRQWKRRHPGHRSFTVLRHPVSRAYRAFENHILRPGKGSFPEIRKTLRRVYNVPLELEGPGPDWGINEQRAAFEGYLRFLKMNLSGQSAVRVDASWASQAQIVQGFAEVFPPDLILREKELPEALGQLAKAAGREAPELKRQEPEHVPLSAIYDDEIEARVRKIYQRDYVTFGFGPWQAAH